MKWWRHVRGPKKEHEFPDPDMDLFEAIGQVGVALGFIFAAVLCVEVVVFKFLW